jgi:hypothetical protein
VSLVTHINPDTIIDFDDRYLQVSLLGNAVRQQILNFYAKPGKVARIVKFANAVDAAGIASTTWHLQVNGADIPFYGLSASQWGAPEADGYLPVEIQVSMGSQITVAADNSSGTAYNATARVVVAYYDPPGFGAL